MLEKWELIAVVTNIQSDFHRSVRSIWLPPNVTGTCEDERKQSPRGVSVKKVFLEISQNSQENTYNFIKKDSDTSVFQQKFCEIFKNPFSYRTPSVAASG